jgi:hypothetical protein
MLQILIVAVVVLLSFVYAVWKLLPAAARKWIARALLARPIPAFAANVLRPYAADAGACGCDGCDRSGKAAPVASSPQPLVFHPRRQR